MKESGKFEMGNLPLVADLETATVLNQEVWRKRNRFASLSSPFELPRKYSDPIIKKVDKEFSQYMIAHKRINPLVGYSILPESPLERGSFYIPDIGKYRSLINFEEFAVDWLTKKIWGKDPVKENSYLNLAKIISREYESSIEGRLLAGLLYVLGKDLIEREEVTKIFASFLLADDIEPLDSLVDYLTEGKVKSYLDCLKTTRSKDIQKFGECKFNGFLESSRWQMFHKNILGSVFRPGIINICSRFPIDLELTHEYIHILSYHKNRSAGIPIKEYKLSKGIFLEENG